MSDATERLEFLEGLSLPALHRLLLLSYEEGPTDEQCDRIRDLMAQLKLNIDSRTALCCSVMAERDAARAEVARLQGECERLRAAGVPDVHWHDDNAGGNCSPCTDRRCPQWEEDRKRLGRWIAETTMAAASAAVAAERERAATIADEMQQTHNGSAGAVGFNEACRKALDVLDTHDALLRDILRWMDDCDYDCDDPDGRLLAKRIRAALGKEDGNG